MNYNKILEMINKIKLNERNNGNECMICQLHILYTDKIIKLKCNHNYHKSCIKENIVCKKYNKIKCPYCAQTSIKKKCKICYSYYYTNECECINNKCKEYFKSGKKKGQLCNRINCKIHKKKIKKDTCTVILKSGKRKGEKCSRINCGYHKNKINIII